MGFPRELGVDSDSKVVVIVSSRDVLHSSCSFHGIGIDGELPLHGNREYCAFVDIKVHLPYRPPLRSTVVRASARGARSRGSIPDLVTPKT